MAGIPQEEIDELRRHADIVDVISHYIHVQRKGKSYVAVCPFHNDHDPSLSISPDKQIFKCFVCGKGGNVFSFVQYYEKISFPEAVGRVADITGFQLSEKTSVQQAAVDPHKKKLTDILKESISFTMYQLHTHEGKTAAKYLEDRGLDEKVCQTFQIGWDPGRDELTRFLKAKGYEEGDLVSANVTNVNEYGMRDVFMDRITFPIHDTSGNPIGFSARTMDRQNPSKYINTNDTDLFHKSDIVYNYHRARQSARQEGKVYVCEGVTDVIAFYRGGLSNAVCTLGTSCTEHQIGLLKRIAARVVFCYDGDHAGQAATMRAGRMALKAGCDISVVLNKTGKDPDEIVRDGGADALKDMVSHELSWMEFVLMYLQSETNMDSYLDKKSMVQKAMVEINALPEAADRKYFADQLEKMTGIPVEVETPTIKSSEPLQTIPVDKVPNGAEEAEEQILVMMMKSPQAVQYYQDHIGYLENRSNRRLAQMIVDMTRHAGHVDPAALMDETHDEAMNNLIARIADRTFPAEYDEKIMAGAIGKVKSVTRQKNNEQMKETAGNSVNKDLNDRFMSNLLNMRRRIEEDDGREEK